MADGVEEQAVDAGAVAPLKVDPNLEYVVRRFRLACGKMMDQMEPQSLGMEGSGQVRYRGHATMGNTHIEFEIFADSRAEAWEKFDGRAVEEGEKLKAAVRRAKLAQAPKIDEFRRQRMGRRLGGGNGGGPR